MSEWKFAGICAVSFAAVLALHAAETEPLFDWTAADKYRATVQHPSGAIKPADVLRARENINRYAWARDYAAKLERAAEAATTKLSPEYLAAMIPETTPGDTHFTPCPACRDRGKPVHPHGMWSWKETRPEELVCDVCHTVFPNEKYPEDVVLHTTWGKPQALTFCGGEPFVIFGYKTGRPSFSAAIRASKTSYMAGLCHSLAEAYLLTGKTEYAAQARLILLRFAQCYPHWLVHVGYGEYADMDPRVASQFIGQLPEPELCPPPNKPDRRLHTGYWSAGRATGVGQESGFVRRVVEAYDFTCTARTHDEVAVYSEADRRTIERDLLLESTVLLVSDKQINNKSVGNRTAAALVGLCVGHPGLVRFGWDGFQQTIDSWFLPDGTTSESPAYATMTLGGIWSMGQALRGYAEPADYSDATGPRRTARDVYHGTAYERVWENCYNGLQGDLKYPAFADSHRTSGLGENFVELMAANYPEHPEYLALLKEECGANLSRAYAPVALYYREPGLEQKSAPPVKLPDLCPPDLRVGYMRTGVDGRESLLLLSASHWGNHHHEDSLNLTYWKEGAELLSDLGYLWDHPKKHETVRTLAHNTVLIDEQDQATKTRGGEVLFFRTSAHVKAMEASSQAYPGAAMYRRTSTLIDHGEGRSYVVDFFRVEGGKTQDFIFHASNAKTEILDATASATSAKLYDFTGARSIDVAGDRWRLSWAARDQTMVAWNLIPGGEQAFIANGWGQRDWKNSDIGATLPYIVRRTMGAGVKTFTSVYAAHRGADPFVRNARLIRTDVVEVTTTDGVDYVLSAPEHGVIALNGAGPAAISIEGHFAVASVRDGKVAWSLVQK